MAKYQGHSSRTAWNVSLWINNDEMLYRAAVELVRDSANRDVAAASMLDYLAASDICETPDGAPYSVTTIKAAMRGM